jgi:crotonobetainyl-CoA:carnitine CoA-transferase CaiB-like acyl-CoA transferase
LPPPRLGEHTEEVLNTVAGYGEDKIAKLRRDGAIT